MKRITILLITIIMSASCSNQAKKSESATSTTNTPENVVEVIYFHAKQRCKTCIAIEQETKQLIDSAFSDKMAEKEIVFKVIDLSDEANETLSEKYRVTFSTLLVIDINNSNENVNDLTQFAFANARNNPDVFKSELRQIITEALTN